MASLASKTRCSTNPRCGPSRSFSQRLLPSTSLRLDDMSDVFSDHDQRPLPTQDARLASVGLDWLYDEAAYDPTELAKALRTCGPAPWHSQHPVLPREFLF